MGFLACACAMAYGRAVACGDGSVDAGLRVGVAVGRGGGADTPARRFCPGALASEALASDVLAMTRAICSWLALSRSTAFTWSRAICCWLTLSCSIACPRVARSRAIDWSNCIDSGDRTVAVGATSCGAV